jgi:hypothetical protein
MRDLTDEQRRALQLLARSPNGCAEALMMAHGFESAMLTDLLSHGLARADIHNMRAGDRPMLVVWMQITAAGRKAIAE